MESNGGRFDFLKSPQFGRAAGALGAAVLAVAAGWYLLSARPQYDLLMLRARAQQDLYGLYDLQVRHKAARGTYAGDLEALLRTAPDGGAALRRALQEHTHLETIVVAGDAQKFRLEANVRDQERTLLRVKGPREADLKR